MLEMLGQDCPGKLVGVLDNKRRALVVPAKGVLESLVFQHSRATVRYHHHLRKCRNCYSMAYLNSFWMNSGTEPELSLIFEFIFVCFIMALLFDMTKNHVLEKFEKEEREEKEKTNNRGSKVQKSLCVSDSHSHFP